MQSISAPGVSTALPIWATLGWGGSPSAGGGGGQEGVGPVLLWLYPQPPQDLRNLPGQRANHSEQFLEPGKRSIKIAVLVVAIKP